MTMHEGQPRLFVTRKSYRPCDVVGFEAGVTVQLSLIVFRQYNVVY